MQYLPTATSMFVTFSAWQSKNLEILNTLHDSAESEEERQAYENALTLFQDSPVMASFAVDSDVMEREIVLEDDEVELDDLGDYVYAKDFESVDETDEEEDNCDCPPCQMRRAIEASLNGENEEEADTQAESEPTLSGIPLALLLAALASGKR